MNEKKIQLKCADMQRRAEVCNMSLISNQPVCVCLCVCVCVAVCMTVCLVTVQL